MSGLGVFRMRYAHLCLGAREKLVFASFDHIMMRVIVPNSSAAQFPEGSTLVCSFVAYGSGSGTRELTVALTDNQTNIVDRTVLPLQFKIREPGYPALAHQAIQLEQMPVPGFGIYYFDFLVNKVHVGRIPVLVMQASGSLPPGEVRLGQVGQGLVLDWGHLLNWFESHPDGTISLEHVYEIWPVLTDPEEPFAMDTKLLLQVSAPPALVGEHLITVVAPDADGNRVDETGGPTALNLVLPGRGLGWLWVDLSGLVLPRAGDYMLEVRANDQRIGVVDVLA